MGKNNLNEMNKEKQILYYIDCLIKTYEEFIKNDTCKEDKNEFTNLLSVLKDIKLTYLKSKKLSSVEEIVMNDFLKRNDKLFDKYYIDELEFNGRYIKVLYERSKKKAYVDCLRRANREKRVNKKELLDNLNYVLVNLKKALEEAGSLEDKIYFELSKEQINEYLNAVYLEIKCWEKYFEEKDYEAIINNFKEIESNVSQLELCLADYEDLFNMNGISYSIFQIGIILSKIMKEGNKNGRGKTNN